MRSTLITIIISAVVSSYCSFCYVAAYALNYLSTMRMADRHKLSTLGLSWTKAQWVAFTFAPIAIPGVVLFDIWVKYKKIRAEQQKPKPCPTCGLTADEARPAGEEYVKCPTCCRLTIYSAPWMLRQATPEEKLNFARPSFMEGVEYPFEIEEHFRDRARSAAELNIPDLPYREGDPEPFVRNRTGEYSSREQGRAGGGVTQQSQEERFRLQQSRLKDGIWLQKEPQTDINEP